MQTLPRSKTGRSKTRFLCPTLLWLAVAALASAAAGPAKAADNAALADLADASALVPKDAVLADLPMIEVAGSMLIHVDLAAPGDPPMPVILDTGTMHALGGNRALATFGGTKRGDHNAYTRETILGQRLTVANVGEQNPRIQADPHVRVGNIFLRGFVVELDFAARRVRFIDPKKYELPSSVDAPDQAVIALAPGIKPAMDVTVNEHPVRVNIDTTVTMPLWIKTRDLMRAAVSPKPLPILRKRAERTSNLRLFETDTVQLRSLELGVLPVIVAQDEHRDPFGINGHVLGLDVLSQFKVQLDIGRYAMWLKRERTEPVHFGGLSYATTRGAGAFLIPVGNWFEVFGVLPRSPAASMGLLPGDRIDPEEVDVANMLELLTLIRQQTPLLIQRPNANGTLYTQQLVPSVAQAAPADSSD